MFDVFGMFSWQTGLIIILIHMHIRYAVSTVYLHRGAGHHVFKFSPVLAHFCRFILWAIISARFGPEVHDLINT